MLEVIIVVHLLRGQDLTAYGLGLIASQLEVDGLVLIEAHVSDSQHQTAVALTASAAEAVTVTANEMAAIRIVFFMLS